MKIIIGTRGSRLALAQADLAKEALSRSDAVDEIEVRIIKTTGDQRLDVRLSDSGPHLEKGLFTKELEQALLNREIDVAVHSLKDLPTETVLPIVAVLPRENPADVLISKTAGGLAGLPKGALVATGSPRRVQQITYRRPDLKVCDVRGNVPTRIEKLVRSESWSGIVLARAGLRRLGLEEDQGRLRFAQSLLFVSELGEMIPAAGQGAVALQSRKEEGRIRSVLEGINDRETWSCVMAEREFLRLIGGGCNVPIGVRADLSGGSIAMTAIIFEATGKVRSASIRVPFQSPHDAARVLFQDIYAERR
jgi:hydroxymethylbilane synthase